MDVSAILVLLLLLTFVVMFVFTPLRIRRRTTSMDAGQDLSALLAERDRILKEIQELDFDNSLGKIPADEYSLQRKVLVQQGADVLRRIDTLRQDRAMAAEAMEKAIQARAVENAVSHASTVTDEDLEVLISERRSARKEKTGGFCPNCGKPFLQSDRFCSCCGQPLAARP